VGLFDEYTALAGAGKIFLDVSKRALAPRRAVMLPETAFRRAVEPGTSRPATVGS